GLSPQTAGNGFQVDLEVIALQPGSFRLSYRVARFAIAELITEVGAGGVHLQAANDLVAVIFRNDDRDRQPLLRRRNQFGGEHHERSITHKRGDAVIWVLISEPHAHGTWNFIPHAGETKFQMGMAP